MNIPPNMTKEEVLKSIEVVALGLGHKFRFGYLDTEDLKQEARLEALKALDNYDPSKGVKLDTFLWTHVKNRLSNLKRDKYERFDKPCLNCPLNAYDPHCKKSRNQCTAFEDKMLCEPYKGWFSRNSAKKNVMDPIGFQNVKDENESRMRKENDLDSILDAEELFSEIESRIPVNLRPSWIKMKNHIKMNKPEREKILSAIKEILEEIGYDTEER